jgi:alpha-beta hydrolase superfamily lysophospholipase
MAEALHQQGANVVVLRAPGHGRATADGSEIAGAPHSLTAHQLADYADDSIDIAVGLGDQVRVHGLSMGGVVSLWVAQHRPEVERVVAMAPAFEIPGVPNAVTTAFTNLFSRTPSFTR